MKNRNEMDNGDGRMQRKITIDICYMHKIRDTGTFYYLPTSSAKV